MGQLYIECVQDTPSGLPKGSSHVHTSPVWVFEFLPFPRPSNMLRKLDPSELGDAALMCHVDTTYRPSTGHLYPVQVFAIINNLKRKF